MKILITLFITLLLITSLVFVDGNVTAQDQPIVLPSSGLTAESPFFFLDRWGEGLHMFFTFNPENKVRLHIRFASERVAEVSVMLEREIPNVRAIEISLSVLQNSANRSMAILNDLEGRGIDVRALAAEFDGRMTLLGNHLEERKKEKAGLLKIVAEQEEEILAAKLADPAFVSRLEEFFRYIARKIDQEVGRPLEGFTVIEDEMNIDVDGDTYTATYRAEANEIVDLVVLRDRILALTGDWESGDISLTEDSLDITFEKEYPGMIVDDIRLFPNASVTISATINSPRAGMTEINYDIDITLETESSYLADALEVLMEEKEEELDKAMEGAEKLLGLEVAAQQTIREAEEAKQGLIDEAVGAGIIIPVGTFGKFDGLLTQAKSAFAAGNFEEAKRLAKQAEKELDAVEKIIENLIKAKEKEERMREMREQKEQREQKVREEQKEGLREEEGLREKERLRQEEGLREEAEREAERLRRERERIEERAPRIEEGTPRIEERAPRIEEEL